MEDRDGLPITQSEDQESNMLVGTVLEKAWRNEGKIQVLMTNKLSPIHGP